MYVLEDALHVRLMGANSSGDSVTFREKIFKCNSCFAKGTLEDLS